MGVQADRRILVLLAVHSPSLYHNWAIGSVYYAALAVSEAFGGSGSAPAYSYSAIDTDPSGISSIKVKYAFELSAHDSFPLDNTSGSFRTDSVAFKRSCTWAVQLLAASTRLGLRSCIPWLRLTGQL